MIPRGQHAVSWFSLVALLAIVVLVQIGRWYRAHQLTQAAKRKSTPQHAFPRATVLRGIGALMVLMFSKFFYLASLSSYYIFYLMSKFHLSVQAAQHYLFLFLAAVAAGTIFGGPIGDRIGRKTVIWVSILGVCTFHPCCPMRVDMVQPFSALSSASCWHLHFPRSSSMPRN